MTLRIIPDLTGFTDFHRTETDRYMPKHTTWVDETEDRNGDPMWAAVCETCPWSSRWVHRDDYVHLLNGRPIPDDTDDDIEYADTDELTTPDDQAYGEAKRRGREHEESENE